MRVKGPWCQVCQTVTPWEFGKKRYCLLCWLGELVTRLSTYADYSEMEPDIPSARVIQRTPMEMKSVSILTVLPQSPIGGEGTRRSRE